MKTPEQLKEEVIEKIKTVFDPELPVNIWELGLIYEVNIVPINNVQIIMTLTAPSCPAAQTLPTTWIKKLGQSKESTMYLLRSLGLPLGQKIR